MQAEQIQDKVNDLLTQLAQEELNSIKTDFAPFKSILAPDLM